MAFIYLIIISFCAILLSILYRSIGRTAYLGSKIPGPPPLPVIGNTLLFVKKSPSDLFKTLCELINEYGPVLKLWIGPHLKIYLSNPDDAEVLFVSQKLIDKSSEYMRIKPWLGEGLLISTGKKWHQRRKILTPAFHFKILEQFVDVFDRQGRTFIESLSKYKSTDKVEFFSLIKLYALDVICETAMGTTTNAQQNSDSAYVSAVHNITHVLHTRMFNFFIRVNWIFKLSKYQKMQDDSLKILHGFTDKVIRERRAKLIETNMVETQKNDNDNEIGTKQKMALLDMLLLSTIDGKSLTNLEIREEVDTFMFEGHDTTTSGITFALYNIAKYPDVQQKCYQEIIETIGENSDRSVTLNDLNSMNYLENVIKETLRLYPSVPVIGRLVNEETTINNYTYPAGTTLAVSIFSMGRDPKLFPNPMKFIPERFDTNDSSNTTTEFGRDKVKNFAYVPFSAGQRNCIGQKFAMLEMKSILSKILQNYEISLDDDSKNEPIMIAELVLKPATPINFYIKPRAI